MWNESSAKPCTRILFLQLLLGVLLLGGVFLLAVNEDIAATQRTMVNTVNYVKEQCNRYSRIGLADESKSLMRIVESANQTAHRLEEATRPVSADFLHTCVKDCYVSGILLLDEAGNITAASEAADMADFVHENLDSEALLNTAQYPEKRYAVRLFCPEGCYLDLAAVQRLDAPGIVVAYYHTPLDYINSFSLSISSLLSGYDPAENGTIVVSSGNEIIASNEESFIGENTDASAVLEEIRAAAVSDRLVSARENGVRYFGLMEHGRDVYVYAYLPQRAVFRTTPENMLFAMVIYLVILAAIRMVRWKTAQSYREEQLAIQKEYTEQLQLKNEQLYAAVEQADRANAAKTSFLSRMSHDIRTPINGIRGMIELADYYSDDLQKQEECRKKIWDASGLLLELINEVLDMGKLESGEILLEEREFNLKKLLGDIVNVVEKQSKEHQLEIVQCDYQIEHWNLIGSPIHIKRMLMNILSNAVKYNRYNGKIILDCREVSCIGNVALIEFICKDTGIGMSKEFQEHIFEPFAQEFNSARSSFGGTGLGMPIAKSLVETMGGNIEFESEKNVGTTFRLKIPFKIDDCVHIEEPTEEEHNVSIEGVRVLVAEDNDLNMEITEFVLSSVGAVVIKASNGQEAIEIFEKSEVGEIDIILMDVMMPGVDGLAATRIIRSMSREDAKTIPIIAMTANAFSEDRLRAVEAGMNEHLAKPLESTVIIKTIAKYLKEE